MPLELEDFETLKAYIDSTPTARVVANVDGDTFKVQAGAFFWQGDLKNGDDVVDWLVEKGAYFVKGWRDIAEIFA
jgi:hypothetical protein